MNFFNSNGCCLNYSKLDPEGLAMSIINRNDNLGIVGYIMCLKLPESILVEPAYYYQSRKAQQVNRYIDEADVLAITPGILTVTMQVGETLTYEVQYVSQAHSDDPAIASVAVNATTATITAVAEGTTSIEFDDSQGNKVMTVNVTVTAAS